MWLPDSNILLRNMDENSPIHAIAVSALDTLLARGERIALVPQVLYEFWSVATRPASARGGLGLSLAEAEAEIHRLLGIFPLYADTPAIFPRWFALVTTVGVSGINVHGYATRSGKARTRLHASADLRRRSFCPAIPISLSQLPILFSLQSRYGGADASPKSGITFRAFNSKPPLF